MGIFNLFTAGKQSEEIARAFIGAYAFSRMNKGRQEVITYHICRMLCESVPFRISYDEAIQKYNTSPGIVQAGFMVNAMIDLRIHHGVPGFRWDYIPNPFALTVYSEKALRKAISKIRKYGIDPDECFAELEEK